MDNSILLGRVGAVVSGLFLYVLLAWPWSWFSQPTVPYPVATVFAIGALFLFLTWLGALVGRKAALLVAWVWLSGWVSFLLWLVWQVTFGRAYLKEEAIFWIFAVTTLCLLEVLFLILAGKDPGERKGKPTRWLSA